jgi:tetratricopeptide (TPR) repeat protein
MDDTLGSDVLFQKGITLLKGKNPLGALACFEKACALHQSPQIKSYLGLCIATERGRITDAVSLCREAIDQDPGNPAHYRNLGKVYLKAERKTDCLEVLRKGLSCGDDAEISALLEVIGRRKQPVFSSLSRRHFLNRYAGLVTRLLRLR